MQELVLIGTGFGIVMGVLVALWGACACIGAAFVRAEAIVAPAAAVSPPAPSAPVRDIPAGTPPAHVAAIAAAVASLSGAYRIVRVIAPPHISPAWSAQGRVEVHTKWQPHAISAARVQISKNNTYGNGES